MKCFLNITSFRGHLILFETKRTVCRKTIGKGNNIDFYFTPLLVKYKFTSVHLNVIDVQRNLSQGKRKKAIIPLTNRVRGLYCKLRTKFFPIDLWPKRQARGPYINGKKPGSVTYSTDRENEVSKIFIISLKLIGRAGNEQLSILIMNI